MNMDVTGKTTMPEFVFVSASAKQKGGTINEKS